MWCRYITTWSKWLMEQGKLTYSPLRKAFEKQVRTAGRKIKKGNWRATSKTTKYNLW